MLSARVCATEIEPETGQEDCRCPVVDFDASYFDDDPDLDLASLPESGFYDKFDGGHLDPQKWLKADRVWGDNNQGVAPSNVWGRDGFAVIRGLGDLHSGIRRQGGALVTSNYFGPGRYEIKLKVLPRMGAASAIWTFQWNHAINKNNEIDLLEIPRASSETTADISFEKTVFAAWTNGVISDDYRTIGDQADGNWHVYRLDWHTGERGTEKRVEFYVDGVRHSVIHRNVPTAFQQLWIGVWFPANGHPPDPDLVGWAGNPNFDVDCMYIDWVKITPFYKARGAHE